MPSPTGKERRRPDKRSSNVRILVGAAWGDEGKGGQTDRIARKADLVVRYQGGANAGHTICREGEADFVCSLVPSGIFGRAKCILAAGMVIDIIQLVREIRALIARGVKIDGRLFIDRNAHLILPYHQAQDGAAEDSTKSPIGTTRRGIGPAYADKQFRRGLRASDMTKVYKEGDDKIEGEDDYFIGHMLAIAKRKNTLLVGYYGKDSLSLNVLREEVIDAVTFIREHNLICDTVAMVRRAIDNGDQVFFEGAQGTLLDVDYGTYPYVTASHPTVGGAFLGTGLSSADNPEVILVSKAYITRVGNGPFPTRDNGEAGQLMAERGHEFGAVTGRPRDCGWLDLPLLRYAAKINGASSIVLTKVDILDVFPKIKVCVAYRYPDGSETDWPDLDRLDEVTPVYLELPGWLKDTTAMRTEAELPTELRDFIQFIVDYVGARISLLSVGPKDVQCVPLEAERRRVRGLEAVSGTGENLGC